MINILKEIFGNKKIEVSILFVIIGTVVIFWFLWGEDFLDEKIDERVDKKLDSELYFKQRFIDSINTVMQAKDNRIQALEVKSGGGK